MRDESRTGPCLSIPLQGAYTGLVALPWLALAHSNIAPLLNLHDAAIETRVILRRRFRAYDALSDFGLRRHGRRTVLTLAFGSSPFTFCGLLRDPDHADAAVVWLTARGCRPAPSP